MTAAFRLWFGALSLREKRLVLVAIGLAILTLFWFGLVRPVGDGLSDSRARHNSAVLRLAATEAQLREVRDLQRRRPAPIGAPLESVVRDRAAQAGFALSSVSPAADNGVQIAIPAARPAAFFAWIADLEDSGILVETMTTSDNGDQTISATLILKMQGL
ncbi:type II secretion system protein GspM [Sphingomonas sp. 28-63-12]|uniref:type II secretion system protein GspM n=1 Tax=Sphingomonas sp. 28-63-12 TaxID=1970434 RepID=UPI000BD28CC3|nr:MAG: hypothetical protein B7Y47_11360 [Sphingomonas sp. 28-63-12]